MQMSFRYVVMTALSVSLLAGCGGGGGGSESAEMDDLSGTISIEARTRVDSDTADDIRVGLAIGNSSNDERPGSTPQSLPGSGIYGGYVSPIGGIYPDPRFDFYADTEDQIRTRLAAGDRVVLQVFAADEGLVAPDVELSISSGLGQLCDTNCQSGPPFVYVHEQDTVDVTVAITANGGGPARYVLTVTSDSQASAMNMAYAEPDFRVDEAVVSAWPAPTGPSLQASGMATALGVSEARALGNGAWHLRRTPASVARVYSGDELVEARKATLDWIRELKVRSDIASAGPNYLYSTQAVDPVNDPLYQLQWHYPLINLPLAWQLAPNAGLDVGVAVMDTGLFSTDINSYGDWHEDLDTNVRLNVSGEFLDYVTGSLDIDTDSGRDQNPADPGDGKAQSSNFHGTHVAGIIAAVDNNIGIVGVASKSTLIPVRVLGRDGSGSLSDLIAAINWAANNSNVHVINLSLGGVAPDDNLENAINAAVANGKLVVAAAGNQGSDEPTYPAAFSNVIGVGAVDGGRKRAGYSNFGASVDLVAPGGDASRDANNDGNADVVISAWGEDTGNDFVPRYAGLQGTSMATPHVAGVYALMKEAAVGAGFTMNPDKFRAWLDAGFLTDEVGNQAEYGAGLINAVKAVNAALEGADITLLSSTPSALQFSSAVRSQEFSLAVYPQDASASVDITGVESPPWLELSPSPSGAPGDEPITATLLTDDLAADASLRDVITINYSGGSQSSLEIPVRLQLGNIAGDTDAGRHYVLLVSTDGDPETLAQQVVEASNGGYGFAFPEVEPGEYFLVAGSDNDNNGLICETGEACAEYPVNGLPEKIVIGNEPIGGVTLTTSFRRPTIASMGLPRYGFEGYRLMTGPSDKSAPVRQLESAP